MNTLEMIRQYGEQLERFFIYAQYCAGRDLHTLVCRSFWVWTIYATVCLGLLIAFIFGMKVFKAQIKFRWESKRLNAQRLADEDAVLEPASHRVETIQDTSLSQKELAAAFRQGIKERAETSVAAVSQAGGGRVKTSPLRELRTVMRDLSSTIKHALSTRVLPLPANAQEESAATAETPRRELSTIMLTDMVDYSGSMERNEEHAYEKLIEHNGIVRTAIANNRGREIKTIGDAFLVVFRSVLDGVDCAIAIQRAFAEYNADKDDENRILLRIGIHSGDILITHNDVFGDDVNIVARIQPLAKPGGICVTQSVYTHVHKKFEFNFERVEGIDLRLKNIAIAPDIYHLMLN